VEFDLIESMDSPSVNLKIKYLVAIADKAFREHVIKLIKNNFADVLVYEAKDGAEANHKLETDPPHILILDDKLSRRSAEQIIASLYHDPKTQDVQTVFIGSQEYLKSFQDRIVAGSIQIVTLGGNMGPLIAAIYKALNRINPTNQDFKLRYLQKGEVFIREGEKADVLYLLTKGRLTAFTGETSAMRILGHVMPGEFVGEMAYINNEPRVASVMADEDCELVEFKVATFDQILFRRPSWMKAMLQTLSKRVKTLNLRRNPKA
jgi:DNA-binding NarL/FixJ family response regulator